MKQTLIRTDVSALNWDVIVNVMPSTHVNFYASGEEKYDAIKVRLE